MLETQILRTLTPYRELKTLEVGARNVCFNRLYPQRQAQAWHRVGVECLSE